MNAITLHIDRSDIRGLCLERADGTRATVGEAIQEGFAVTSNAAACLLTWAQRHIEAKEAHRG